MYLSITQLPCTPPLLRSRGPRGLCILSAEDPPRGYTYQPLPSVPCSKCKIELLETRPISIAGHINFTTSRRRVANPQSRRGICVPGRDHRCRRFRDGLNPCISSKTCVCWQEQAGKRARRQPSSRTRAAKLSWSLIPVAAQNDQSCK